MQNSSNHWSRAHFYVTNNIQELQKSIATIELVVFKGKTRESFLGKLIVIIICSFWTISLQYLFSINERKFSYFSILFLNIFPSITVCFHQLKSEVRKKIIKLELNGKYSSLKKLDFFLCDCVLLLQRLINKRKKFTFISSEERIKRETDSVRVLKQELFFSISSLMLQYLKCNIIYRYYSARVCAECTVFLL